MLDKQIKKYCRNNVLFINKFRSRIDKFTKMLSIQSLPLFDYRLELL